MSQHYIIFHWGEKNEKGRIEYEKKYEKIKEYVDHGGNKNRIALQLNISKRHLDRLIIKYKEKGKSAFMHGNRFKTPVNASSLNILYYL